MLRSSIRITSVPLVLLRERHLSTISYRPVDPHNVDSSYFQYFGNFFHNFFCYHIGITFRSRSLVVFFQLRSVSCAPFTPAFADGVVQRSLALYLPCFVSLCSPVWLRAISHRTLPIFHHEPQDPFSVLPSVAHGFPFLVLFPFYDTVRLASLH